MRSARVSLFGLLAIGVWSHVATTRAWADNLCKPAGPVPQAKCNKDAQCCPGLVCQTGVCQPGCRISGTFYSTGNLNPVNPCQSCQPSKSTSAFSSVSNGTACNDGNACTQTDICQSGTCVGGSSVTCTALDQCHTAGTCDPTTAVCSNPVRPDGTTCNDGNACTEADACVVGVCIGSNPVSCVPLDQCHDVGTCDPSNGSCSNPTKPDATPCDDGRTCTTGDNCQSGICVGTGCSQTGGTVEAIGLTLDYSSGWQFNANILSAGGPISLNNFSGNYLQGGFVPRGGAEIDVFAVPLPSSPITDIIQKDLSGTTVESTASLTIAGVVGTRVVFSYDITPTVFYREVRAYVSHNGLLYRFSVFFKAGDSRENEIVAFFDQLLGTVRFTS